MPIAGCSARHIRGPSTLIARAPERAVQFRLHKILDEPPHPIPDHRLDRIKPGRPEKFRRRVRQVSAILRHGVISIGVSPPSLARFTSRRLYHSEIQPLSRWDLQLQQARVVAKAMTLTPPSPSLVRGSTTRAR